MAEDPASALGPLLSLGLCGKRCPRRCERQEDDEPPIWRLRLIRHCDNYENGKKEGLKDHNRPKERRHTPTFPEAAANVRSSECQDVARRPARGGMTHSPRHERTSKCRSWHPVAMTSEQELLDDAKRAFAPLRVTSRTGPRGVVVDLLRSDGTVLWPDYAFGQSETMAILAAEQRYLTEQVGSGSTPGATYADKAAERLRRHRASR